MNDSSHQSPPTPKLQAILQLVRLPNVFTAIADVAMGYLFTHFAGPAPTLHLPGEFWALVAASACLYCAGMVLNDVNDLEIDRLERPQRPIPSGSVSLRLAFNLGYGLLFAGIAFAFLAGYLTQQYRAGFVAIVLAVAIALYDSVLKKTPIAPVLMGACRTLNVLLGMSLISTPWHATHYVIAAGIGLYIIGVTCFARTEARQSSRLKLSLSLLPMAAGMLLLASFPGWLDPQLPAESHPQYITPDRWHLIWGVIGLLILGRCVWAVIDPSPQRVQYAVKNSIFSLIMLDAIVVMAVRDVWWSAAVLLLLVPTMYLGRWIYST